MNLTSISKLTSLVVLTLSSSFSLAETVPNTDISVNFESANIVGTGRSVNMHRVPVVNNDNGITTYVDISFKLSSTEEGELTFDGFTQIESSEVTSAANFIAGYYISTDGNIYQVTGGAEAAGQKLWSITKLTGNHIFNASWSDAPKANNILIKNQPIFESLIDGFSYGIVGNESFSSWAASGIMSASQTGTNITMTRHVSPDGAIATSFTLHPATTEELATAGIE